MVRVALARFGEEVSPRFCCSPEALVVDWDGKEATELGIVSLGSRPYPARLERLAEMSVTWLVCGSFPRERLPDARRCGIRVSCGVSGRLPRSPTQLARFLARLTGGGDDS